jgi:MFS family permease
LAGAPPAQGYEAIANPGSGNGAFRWSEQMLDAFVRLRTFAALRYREYRLLSVSQAFGTMSLWMDEVARGWLIYELTDSALQLGVVRGLQAVVFLALAPLAGGAADRYSRKGQLAIAQAANAAVLAWLAFLIFAGMVEPWHVYLTAVLVALAQVFQQPATAALISDAVPRDYLTNAIGLGAIIYNIARTLGPALAGLLIVVAGTGAAFGAQAALLLFATAATLMLGPAKNPRPGSAKESFLQSILEGWRFSLRSEPVRAGLACAMLAHFFIVPFTTLLPVFARDLLEVGAHGQGLLLAAMGIGALASSFLLASAGPALPRGMLMLGASTLYGGVLVVFATSPWFALSLAAMLAAGICQVGTNALVQTIVQSYSPAEYRGRVMAIFSMHQVLITVGAVLISALAEFAGPRWAVAGMGIAGSLAMVAMNSAMPGAKRVR